MANQTPAWAQLQEEATRISQTHLRDLLQDEARCAAMTVQYDGITLDYARQCASLQTMDYLFDLAAATNVSDAVEAMRDGEHINLTEDRAVMHMALRAPADMELAVDGVNVVPAVHEVLQRISAFSERVRSGAHVGCTGKPLTDVVSIGIGGSYLGPEFVFEALKAEPSAAAAAEGRRLRFLANVDPVDVTRALTGLDPETTLVIVVSKTFTTAETMLNARTVRKWLTDALASKADSGAVTQQHMVAVSANVPGAEAFGIDAANVFGFWDWVGGRYSVCSAVGMLPLSLQYGFPQMEQFLAGAHSLDQHFINAPPRENLPLIMAVLGVWNVNFLNHSAHAILPYSQALLRFPAHIQQLEMESNGKRVACDGSVLPYPTGEVFFGEPGTNGQHSFYQLIHQGTVVPATLIGFCEAQTPMEMEGEAVSNHDALMANFFAQADALAVGKTAEELEAAGVPAHLQPHKEFPGNRPTLSLLLQRLNAYSVGQLLALFENRVAAAGFIWGVNSFDQFGVELGKVLASTVQQQMEASRKRSAEVAGFNPSTTRLMNQYLRK